MKSRIRIGIKKMLIHNTGCLSIFEYISDGIGQTVGCGRAGLEHYIQSLARLNPTPPQLAIFLQLPDIGMPSQSAQCA
jgi:hypothetical protein